MQKTEEKHALNLKQIKIDDAFWNERINVVMEKVIPYQWDALNDNIPDVPSSHSVENFRIAAGLTTGEFNGMPFQDSDVTKWIEAASYSINIQPNPKLEKLVDELVGLIEKAQLDSGYVNTYFTVAKPDQKWKDLSHGHELYCAGHMIEAGVAYYQATGNEKLLLLSCKFVDYIDQIIGPEEGKMNVYPGHPEVELALVRLYDVTNEDRYLRLAEFFVNQRGKNPDILSNEKSFAQGNNDKWFQLDYHQAHQTVRDQGTAEGHSVRAMYLYCAMADLALKTGDDSLLESTKILWDNVVNKRMYITGGLGSQGHGERFTLDYDLPNDVAYAETCASIGLVFWAQRMAKLEVDSKYADIMERALYNGVLSGISLDGEKYLYVNPLEVFPQQANCRHDHNHVEAERVGWFGCACCPPNIARLITSLGQYIYSQQHRDIFVHLYIGNESTFNVDGNEVQLIQTSNYLKDGRVRFDVNTLDQTAFTLNVRVPGWCRQYLIKVNGEAYPVNQQWNNGYVAINREWKKGDTVELFFEISINKMRSHPKVKENAGKIALQRGPVVYCLEEVDNGKDLMNITIPKHATLTETYDPAILGGTIILTGQGNRVVDANNSDSLYQSTDYQVEEVNIKAVPYSSWGNRKPGEMIVWIRES